MINQIVSRCAICNEPSGVMMHCKKCHNYYCRRCYAPKLLEAGSGVPELINNCPGCGCTEMDLIDCDSCNNVMKAKGYSDVSMRIK